MDCGAAKNGRGSRSSLAVTSSQPARPIASATSHGPACVRTPGRTRKTLPTTANARSAASRTARAASRSVRPRSSASGHVQVSAAAPAHRPAASGAAPPDGVARAGPGRADQPDRALVKRVHADSTSAYTLSAKRAVSVRSRSTWTSLSSSAYWAICAFKRRARRVQMVRVAAQHGRELRHRRRRILREQRRGLVRVHRHELLRLQQRRSQRARRRPVLLDEAAAHAQHAAGPVRILAHEVVRDLEQAVAVADHPAERVTERERLDLALLQRDAEQVGGILPPLDVVSPGRALAWPPRWRRSSCRAPPCRCSRPSCPSGRRSS